MEHIEAIVSGRVQMVMYRDFAMRKARKLGLVGEVENLPDGTVRVIAEGEREKLDQLIQKLWKGPLLAEVREVSVKRKPATGTFYTFKIAYS